MTSPELDDDLKRLLDAERDTPLRGDLDVIRRRVLANTLASVVPGLMDGAGAAEPSAATGGTAVAEPSAVAGGAGAAPSSAVGGGAGAATSSAVAGGAAAASAGVLSGGAATFALGVLVGGAVMLPVGWIAHRELSPEPPSPVPVMVPAPPVAPPAPVPRPAAPAPRPAAPAPRPATPVPLPTAPAPGVPAVPDPMGGQAEVALIERARAALARGRPTNALQAVMEHARVYGDSSLAEERERLHIEALWVQGRRDASRERYERFRQRWPDSVHTQGLEALLDAP